MVVQQQRCQYGRLRASFWPAERQFSDRLSRNICDYGTFQGSPVGLRARESVSLTPPGI